ncbi:hypothetical protein EVAR_20881_1 [Eumeta japonica]|uniref:Uncharacterized protein n=1 Tax=Eumeta variegata TaxID=151549 RepID=A0A4C1UW17_EUMVA|nr:hypothetical protein EVAR_20881_1 [Eumeta japonica]
MEDQSSIPVAKRATHRAVFGVPIARKRAARATNVNGVDQHGAREATADARGRASRGCRRSRAGGHRRAWTSASYVACAPNSGVKLNEVAIVVLRKYTDAVTTRPLSPFFEFLDPYQFAYGGDDDVLITIILSITHSLTIVSEWVIDKIEGP